MAVDWQEIDDAYYELLAARREGQTATLQRLTEFQMCLSMALDEHVREVVIEDRWSWQRVADAIGVTRQAASKRWRNRVFPPAKSAGDAPRTDAENWVASGLPPAEFKIGRNAG